MPQDNTFTPPNLPRKIAILGGGIGGLTAALELSATEDLRSRYNITVYQMGWRLGGKCATGRNARLGNRIEEHGIHGFTGAYFNALTMMTAVYEEWKRLPPSEFGPSEGHPMSTFAAAFPTRNSWFFWERHDGVLKRWRFFRPPNALTIADAPKFKNLASWLAFIKPAFAMRIAGPSNGPATAAIPPASILDAFLNQVEAATAVAEPSALSTTGSSFSPAINWAVLAPILARDLASETPGESDNQRRDRITLGFLTTVLRGVRDDQIEAKGFKSIDGEDFGDWLRRHGASEEIIASPLALSPINTTYQYPDGDYTQRPVMSASSYLQWLLRGFVSLGSPFYLFAAGSGETLITPIYAVLRSRGVKFAFFHRVEDVIPEDGQVERIKMTIQAELQRDVYEPLVRVGGLDAWPNEPLREQLKGNLAHLDIDFEDPSVRPVGAKSVMLQRGRDFDAAILAIPAAAAAIGARSLCAEAQWDRAFKMPTVATQSMQIWLSKPLDEYGEKETDPLGQPYYWLAGNFCGGPHGHADFSLFLPFETWSPSASPKAIAYFSGVLANETNAVGLVSAARAADDLRAKHECVSLLKISGSALFAANAQGAGSPFSFDFQSLFCLNDNVTGSARFDQQYWRANSLPSERYTRSPAGTKAVRVGSVTGFKNLTIAGDWSDFGLNVGSFEGACMSGLLAASAVEASLPVSRVIGFAPTTGDEAL